MFPVSFNYTLEETKPTVDEEEFQGQNNMCDSGWGSSAGRYSPLQI